MEVRRIITWIASHQDVLKRAMSEAAPNMVGIGVVYLILVSLVASHPFIAALVAWSTLAVLCVTVCLLFVLGAAIRDLGTSLLQTPPTQLTTPTRPSPSQPPTESAEQQPAVQQPTHTDAVDRSKQRAASVLGVVPDAADLFVPIDEQHLFTTFDKQK